MPTEYEKRLEEENEALRKTIRFLEDDIFDMENKLSKYNDTLLNVEDMRKILITSMNLSTPASSTITYNNKNYHIQGRSEIKMELQFSDPDVAVKLKGAIDAAIGNKL